MTEQKIETFWRDATADDVARVMKGEKVEARFRDFGMVTWNTGRFLAGYDALSTTGMHWIASNANQWKFCQVYDPPAWFLNKPDPGEGWRLLKKFPDEPKLTTDEFFETFDNKWTQVGDTGSIQYHGVWYRRRIEPVKQDAGSTSASNIPKGWTALSLDEPRLESDAYWSQDASEWCLIGDGWIEAANREKWPAIRFKNHFLSLVSIPGSFEWVTKVGDVVRHPNGKRYRVQKDGWEYVGG